MAGRSSGRCDMVTVTHWKLSITSVRRSDDSNRLQPHHHQPRPNTNMDSRNPFSRGFRKLKHKLAGGHRKRDGRSSENEQGEREADVEGSEASQMNSRLHSEVEDVVESGPSREGNGVAEEVDQVNPSRPTPSIPRSEVSGSM